jgi:hypothetical protein
MLYTVPWFRAKPPAPSLGGGTRRYKPVITISVGGPRARQVRQILADTGADDVVFPDILASHLGIDLSLATPGSSFVASGSQPIPVLFAPVVLTLDDGKESCRWRAVVGFAPLRSAYGLFGIAGGLEHFRTTLDGGNHSLELVPLPP